MKNNQSGAIIVEASLTLTMFICLLASIIALTNLFIVHNRIQYALTQTSNTISHYGYLYTAVGLQSVDQQNNQKIENDTKEFLNYFFLYPYNDDYYCMASFYDESLIQDDDIKSEKKYDKFWSIGIIVFDIILAIWSFYHWNVPIVRDPLF